MFNFKERYYNFFINFFYLLQTHWSIVAWLEHPTHRLYAEFTKWKTILSTNTPYAIFNGVITFGTGKFCQKNLKFSKICEFWIITWKAVTFEFRFQFHTYILINTLQIIDFVHPTCHTFALKYPHLFNRRQRSINKNKLKLNCI